MSNPALQPRHAEPVVDPRSGIVTRAWADYFLRLSTQQSSDDLAQLYQQLAERVSELEEGGALGFQIFGQDSIILEGSTQPGAVLVITLQGDQESPADTSYYGTGPDGVKGWHPVSGAIQVVSDELTKAVDADGVTTLGLADVADAGTGTLQKTQFDGKGRKTGTAAATTTDLPEGANLYYTDGRVDARVNLQKGQPNGLAPLDADSLIPTEYLPPYPAFPVTSVNARTGAVAVPDYVSKSTAPVAADYGRAVIEGDRWFNTANGIEYTRVGGAWVDPSAASVAASRFVPAYLASGALSQFPLDADGKIPAYLADGTYSPFATQA